MSCVLFLLLGLAVGRAAAQPVATERFDRPLPEVLGEVAERFGVRISCKRFDPDTVTVACAAFRIRPYSLEETLDNVLRPLSLAWTGERKITVQPYEYYRRKPADGAKLLAWLSAQYDDRASWEERRTRLLADLREALELGPFLRGLAPQPRDRFGREVRRDGYTTRNYAFETLPGLYVCGTIYAPDADRSRPASLPLVVAPSGHWAGGRYRADHQLLMIGLARMGAGAVDMDIFGWGESERQIGIEAHTTPYAMQMQALWSKVVIDRVIAACPEIDTARMAATGGSGGATHALLLAALDGRFAALAPVVHLVSHFDGGCPCESGRPVTLAGGGSCLPELLAAAMAPRPVLAVSDGGDWTASYPALEYPFLRRIWDFYGAGERVRNVHLSDERHDFGPSKRLAVCDFFAETFGLDLAQLDEKRVDLGPEEVRR
ncbi:MAG: acetylxylan esterase, partial [Alistipes sp.]|nr:acetylxylan esterase [Alistipes sp.]